MKVFLCFALLTALAITAAAADVNVTGKWSGTFSPEGQDQSSAYMILKQSGTTITGTAGPDEGEQWQITKGKIQGGKMTAEVQSPDGAVYQVDMVVVDADHIKGDVTFTQGGQTMKGKLEVSRVK